MVSEEDVKRLPNQTLVHRRKFIRKSLKIKYLFFFVTRSSESVSMKRTVGELEVLRHNDITNTSDIGNTMTSKT